MLSRFLARRSGRDAAALLLILSAALATPLPAQLRFLESRRAVPADPGMGLLAPSPTRTIIDLNGRWGYRVDATGERGTISVPSSFTGADRVTFTREFSVDASLAAQSVFQLVALSISYSCEIRINDQFIGKHAGDATFSVKVSPGIIRAGRNTIRIDVQNVLNARETVPGREQAWSPTRYGGIIHDIAITANGAVWVQETSVHTEVAGDGRPATVSYQALLNSGPVTRLAADSARVVVAYGRSAIEHAVEVVDVQTGETVYRSEARRVVIESDRLTPVDLSFTIPSVRVWSPETPYLYMLRQRTSSGGRLVDESTQMIGFRTIRATSEGLRLNGQPLYVRGVTWHEDSPWHGRSLSMDELERDVLLIKNLGANTVRLPMGPAHPQFYTLCDRYGLLVLQDLPTGGMPPEMLASMGVRTTARNLLREMLIRDQNRPSIVGYGFVSMADGARTAVDEFIAAVQRPGTHGRETHLTYATYFRLPDALPDAVDFAGLDIPITSVERAHAFVQSAQPVISGKPVLVTSLSHPVEIGNYLGYSDPRSIDAQAQFYLELYPAVRERGFQGFVAHAFSDWSVSIPLMPVDRVQQYTATAGMVDVWRQKRLAYDVLKARFNNEKPPVLTIGTFELDHPVTFVIVGIFLIFVFAIVYNLFRRFRENVVRSFLRPHNFFTDVRDQRMLSIFQTTVVGVLGSLSAALFHANLTYFWRTDVMFDAMLAQLCTAVWLKQWLNYAAWNPLPNLLVVTLLFFVVLFLYSLLVRALAFFLKRGVTMFDAYSVAMWSVLPMAMLAPFGMVLYRVLDVGVIEAAAVLAWIGFHVWIVSRLLKGTAIVLDVRPVYFHLLGFGLLGIAAVAWMLSLDADHGVISQLRHLASVWIQLQRVAS